MAEQPLQRDDDDEVLRRAEALLRRHRGAAVPAPAPLSDVPLLTDAVEFDLQAPAPPADPAAAAPGAREPDPDVPVPEPELPTLDLDHEAAVAETGAATDYARLHVPEPGEPPAPDHFGATAPDPAGELSQDSFDAAATEPVEAYGSPPEPPAGPLAVAVSRDEIDASAAPGEVISRVQAQNMEHSVYQRLKRDLDDRIAGVVQERFLPEIGNALDAALAKIATDLRSDIGAMVRGTIEEALRTQLMDLRTGLEARAAAAPAGEPAPAAAPAGGSPAAQGPAAAGPSDIMPAFSAMSVPSPRPAADTDLAKSFEPAAIEARWYPFWEKNGYFEAAADDARPAYCIQLPPPNVTGTLHMGHAFQQTLMDALARYHRMCGRNVNWVVGTDHAGIATQIVVERQLQARGLTRHDLGREAFVKRVWEWKQESGSTITRQMRRLGASANWGYADSEGQHAGYFTMDEKMSLAVVEVFVRLYEEGLIYRGKRLVNWDPVLGTAVSDLEVDSEEEDGRIWEIRYPLEDGTGAVVVATTRPETMLGDVAVAVNPGDSRYLGLIGKRIRLPLTGRSIPLIADDYVDPAFGTGCVKITPGHDVGSSRVDLQACKLEYSIVSPK